MRRGIVEFVSTFEDGEINFAEAAKPMSAAEGRARIAALKKENAQMRMAQHTRQSQVDSRIKLDADIKEALFSWHRQAKNMHSLSNTPESFSFTNEELALAGWIREYAAQKKLTFKSALDQIFDYLKRYPKALENATNDYASFAESANGGAGLVVPRGCSVDPKRMESFRRVRVYQAGHPGCEFSEAITLAGIK